MHLQAVTDKKFALGLLFLLAGVFLLLGVFTSTLSHFTTDYNAVANNIANGFGLVSPSGTVFSHHPPLFPLLVGLEYALANLLGIPKVWITSLFSLVLLWVSGLLVFKISNLLNLDKKVSRLAFAIAIFHPFLLYSSFHPLSIVLFNVFFLLGLQLILKCVKGNFDSRKLMINAVLLGLIWGLALLTRSIFIGIPLLFIVLMVMVPIKKSLLGRFVLPCVFLVTLIATVAPWSVYVSQKSGKTVLISTSGPASIRDGLSFNHKSFRSPLNLPKAVEKYSNAFWSNYNEMNEVKDIRTFMLQKLKDSPIEVLGTYTYKALRSWYGVDSQNKRYELANGCISLISLLLGFWGFRKWRRESKTAKWWLLILCLTLAYFWFMATLALSIVRYMLPVFILLSIPISYLLCNLKSNKVHSNEI